MKLNRQFTECKAINIRKLNGKSMIFRYSIKFKNCSLITFILIHYIYFNYYFICSLIALHAKNFHVIRWILYTSIYANWQEKKTNFTFSQLNMKIWQNLSLSLYVRVTVWKCDVPVLALGTLYVSTPPTSRLIRISTIYILYTIIVLLAFVISTYQLVAQFCQYTIIINHLNP